MKGEMAAGGTHSMSNMGDRLGLAKDREPRVLTLSEIRTQVEDIAEELANQMRPAKPEMIACGVQAIPLDNRKFIHLMSDFVRMN